MGTRSYCLNEVRASLNLGLRRLDRREIHRAENARWCRVPRCVSRKKASAHFAGNDRSFSFVFGRIDRWRCRKESRPDAGATAQDVTKRADWQIVGQFSVTAFIRR